MCFGRSVRTCDPLEGVKLLNGRDAIIKEICTTKHYKNESIQKSKLTY